MDDPAVKIALAIVKMHQNKRNRWTLADFIIGLMTAASMLMNQLPYGDHLRVMEKARMMLQEHFNKRLK